MEEIRNLVNAIFEAKKRFDGCKVTEEKEDIIYNASMTASVYYTEFNHKETIHEMEEYFEMSEVEMIQDLKNCLISINSL